VNLSHWRCVFLSSTCVTFIITIANNRTLSITYHNNHTILPPYSHHCTPITILYIAHYHNYRGLSIQHHATMPGSTPWEIFPRQEASYVDFVIHRTVSELTRIQRTHSPPRWKDDEALYQLSLTPKWALSQTPTPSSSLPSTPSLSPILSAQSATSGSASASTTSSSSVDLCIDSNLDCTSYTAGKPKRLMREDIQKPCMNSDKYDVGAAAKQKKPLRESIKEIPDISLGPQGRGMARNSNLIDNPSSTPTNPLRLRPLRRQTYIHLSYGRSRVQKKDTGRKNGHMKTKQCNVAGAIIREYLTSY